MPSIIEGDLGSSLIEFPITPDPAVGAELVVGYETFPIEAEAGVDYMDAAGQLTIAAGDDQGDFEIEVLGDMLEEADERIGVRVLPGNRRLVSDEWQPVFSGANYWTDAAEVAVDERHLAISTRGNVEVYKKSVAGWEQVALLAGGRTVRLEGDTLIVGYSTCLLYTSDAADE